MQFEDQAITLSARSHAETGAIVHMLTRDHGHMAAHVAGGASRRLKPYLQPGSRIEVSYRARTEEHLGQATIEGVSAGGVDIFDDPLALMGLQCACVMTEACLPEREAAPGVYAALDGFLTLLGATEVWPYVYVRYELGLLEALGFGLDLSACAVTGQGEDLIHVSPKSGRAVSAEAGAPYRDKLLPLPGFLRPAPAALEPGDLLQGLDLSGYFLERHVFHSQNRPLPDIRQRLRDRLADAA